MKRLSLIALSFVFLLGGGIAHAQQSSGSSQSVSSGGLTATPPSTTVSAGDLINAGTPSVTQNADGTYSVASTPTPSAAATSNANNTTPTAGAGNPVDAFGPIFGVIMELFAWLMGIAGIILNDAIYYTVVKMGSMVNGLSAVGVTWQILRDIGNIVLIFGFLAVGISTILGLESYGISRRIVTLIVVAIFLNFSLFIAEAIIDTGNFFATEFYSQIVGGTISAQSDPGSSGISNAIMDTIGLQTLYNLNPQGANGQPQAQGWISEFNSTTMFTALLAIILFIVASFTLFSIAFILVARLVALIFLIIVAPIGFAGLLIPKFESTAKEWWSQLVNQTLTAPAMLLLLYIALAVITDAQFLTGFNATKNGWSGAVNTASSASSGVGLAGFAGVELAFMVAMGLLLACVVIAKRLGAFAGDTATKWAGAASFGVAGWAGRNTVGWGAAASARYLRKTRLASVPMLGRSIIGGLDQAGKFNFDGRGVKALKELKIDAGTAHKGGYSDDEKKAIEEREKYAASLKQTKGDKDKEATLKQRKDTEEASYRRSVAATAEAYRPDRERAESEIKLQRKKVDDARTKATATQTDADKKALADEELALNNRQRELEKIRGEESEFQSSLKTAHEQALAEIDSGIKLTQTAQQRRYARGLVWGPGAYVNRNVEAAKKIVDNAGKSKQQKDVESFMKSVEDSAKKAGGGGGGDAAH